MDELVKGSFSDIASSVVAMKMLQNANELGKVTLVYFHESGTPVPLEFRALSQRRELGKKFEFMVVQDPDP